MTEFVATPHERVERFLGKPGVAGFLITSSQNDAQAASSAANPA